MTFERVKEKFATKTARYVLFALFFACLFLFIRGYQFNTDDQAEHLPQVYQLIDPALYPHDYFVTEYHHTYSLRSVFVWVVYSLSFLAPVSVVCFVLTLLCITLSVYSFMRITEFYTPNKITVYVAPFLVFFLFYKFTLGGNTITQSCCICSTIALSLAAYGLLLFLRKNYFGMAMALGIGTLFQVMDAAQPFFLLALFMMTRFRIIGLKTLFFTVVIYLIFAGGMLFPMLYHQFVIHYSYDAKLYAYIQYFFRNPNHFVPSHFPVLDYLCFVILMFVGLGQLLEKVNSAYRWFSFLTGNFIVVGCIIYFVCFEVFQEYWIAKTQFFKSTMWIASMSSVFIAIGLVERLPKTLDAELIINNVRRISLIGIPILLFILLNSAMLPIPKLQGRYMIGNYKKTDLTLMHEWIAGHTDKDKTILTFPSDFSFACEAKRSMPIGWKAIIHEPFFMMPWYKKFRDVYSTALVSLHGNDALTVADSCYQKILYAPEHPPVKIDYRMDDITKCTFVDALGKEIHRQGNYILTEFKSY